VTLFASSDGTLDAADARLGDAVRSLRLKPGKSATIKVALQSPPSLRAGDYTILARVDTGSSAIADANAANDVGAAPVPLAVRDPFADLLGRFVKVPDAPLEAFAGGRGSSGSEATTTRASS